MNHVAVKRNTYWMKLDVLHSADLPAYMGKQVRQARNGNKTRNGNIRMHAGRARLDALCIGGRGLAHQSMSSGAGASFM